MDQLDIFFRDLYRDFNGRKIDLVIAQMTEDVKWANGMEGGFVHGHTGVREYWTRQFELVSANVTPLEIDAGKETVKIKVHQVVRDLNGTLLGDELIYHFFQLKENKIQEFRIGE